MEDNTNVPVLIPHNSTDVRQQSAYVVGIALLTGPAEGWASRVAQDKKELTFLRSGQSTRVTIRQEAGEGYNTLKNCLSDPDGTIMKNYKGDAVRITAGVAILRPDGSVESQDISTGDMSVAIQRQ
jgi:hypothetical protein